jgi:hypothetical protein
MSEAPLASFSAAQINQLAQASRGRMSPKGWSGLPVNTSLSSRKIGSSSFEGDRQALEEGGWLVHRVRARSWARGLQDDAPSTANRRITSL